MVFCQRRGFMSLLHLGVHSSCDLGCPWDPAPPLPRSHIFSLGDRTNSVNDKIACLFPRLPVHEPKDRSWRIKSPKVAGYFFVVVTLPSPLISLPLRQIHRVDMQDMPCTSSLEHLITDLHVHPFIRSSVHQAQTDSVLLVQKDALAVQR